YRQRQPPCATLFPYTTLFRSERGQRQREGRVRQPDRPERAVDTQVDVGRQQRHERDLDGHDLQGEHRDEQEVATLEVDPREAVRDRKSTRLNSSHVKISYAVF